MHILYIVCANCWSYNNNNNNNNNNNKFTDLQIYRFTKYLTRCRVGITCTSHWEGTGFKSGHAVHANVEHMRVRIARYEMIAGNSRFSVQPV